MPKSISIYIPDELVEKMDKLPEVNWSEIARQCIEGYIEKRERLEEVKLQIHDLHDPRQISYDVLPRFDRSDQALEIGFYIQNHTEGDVILDRILFTVKLADQRGVAIGVGTGTYLDKYVIEGGGTANFMSRPNLSDEVLQKLLQTASKNERVKMEIIGRLYFDSKKGIVRMWVHKNAEALPVFFLGE